MQQTDLALGKRKVYCMLLFILTQPHSAWPPTNQNITYKDLKAIQRRTPLVREQNRNAPGLGQFSCLYNDELRAMHTRSCARNQTDMIPALRKLQSTGGKWIMM